MGKAVHLTPEEKYNADLTFDLNRFNVVVSDRIALNRTLPDVRPPRYVENQNKQLSSKPIGEFQWKP